MSDAVSLTTLSSIALTEGIRFLYSQAGELLKRHRDRADAEGPVSNQETPEIVAVPRFLPSPDLQVVGNLEDELRGLRSDLHEYASGLDLVEPDNISVTRRIEALRRVLEAVYATPLIFKGEDLSRTEVRGSVTARDIAGYVAGVRVEHRLASDVYGAVQADNVMRGAEVIGVDIRRIEPSGPET